MNFEWTPEQRALRERVRALLARELPPDWEHISRHGPGSPAQTAFSLAFCPKLAAEGLLVPHWPAAHGGRDAPAWEHFIIGEELFAAGEPRGPQYMNANFIGATLMKFGTPQQQARYLPDMAAGRAVWCQGFSEPSAGSDLAALATRAVPRGGEYVINGSKVWTSYAGMAQTCFLLARTDAGKGGIAIFLVPMDTPGITVRPIPSLIGHGDIHEVFFDDVVVPAAARLGEEGQAWAIIGYALSLERVGLARYAFSRRVLDRMVGELTAQDRFADSAVRAQAAQALAACEAARLLVYRVVDERARGLPPSAVSNLARVAVVKADHAVSDFALAHFGDALCGDRWPLVLAHHERAIAAGIASGAAEIQLNLVANDWLQLPRESRLERS
ncbi:acyl-CoA dehydrogenase [Variovorax paradoxus]|uniref:acyl-CoA dehydrogenase family protein n=1 Tax=Variovorax paradoxus TaxID=34073 RepID=UPI0006E64419|nr:acyl-CoA dehydrogenase [Variovorax paradoxus]KPU97631.1 acyl-CoA dehydrogenase [Variovorax paradoxus]KPV04670.1 acyl-CoA dehydrogenase [Variovorax paradoxus]KPV20370.1 acyl-CoA dehydrogenase [Variovorax paradoxus]KPV25774.1 acyl-CoA dehydrogenase [Variovorax paradoxus]